MKQTDPQYKLRLSQELKEKIEAAAKHSGRSMNAEIVMRLEGTFQAHLSGRMERVRPGEHEVFAAPQDILQKLGERLTATQQQLADTQQLVQALWFLDSEKEVPSRAEYDALMSATGKPPRTRKPK